MVSIRGATTVSANAKDEILEAASSLLKEILSRNNVNIDDVISVIFTCTKDLDAVYPAAAARELGMVNAALMCFDELYVKGSLEKCIRVMLNADIGVKQKDVRHVYLNGAQILRPDLIG